MKAAMYNSWNFTVFVWGKHGRDKRDVRLEESSHLKSGVLLESQHIICLTDFVRASVMKHINPGNTFSFRCLICD